MYITWKLTNFLDTIEEKSLYFSKKKKKAGKDQIVSLFGTVKTKKVPNENRIRILESWN